MAQRRTRKPEQPAHPPKSEWFILEARLLEGGARRVVYASDVDSIADVSYCMVAAGFEVKIRVYNQRERCYFTQAVYSREQMRFARALEELRP